MNNDMGESDVENILNNLVGLSGLILGVISYLIINYFVREKQKKKRVFDERYQYIHHRAKAKVWDINWIALIIIWGFVILYDGIGFAFFLMTGIYILHCLLYLFTAAYFSSQVE